MFTFLTPYLMWIKIGAAAVVLGLITWGGLTVRGWHQDSLKVASVEAQAKRDKATYTQTLSALQQSYADSLKASKGYQDELTQIASRPVPSTPVRLCRAASSVRPASPATGGPGPAVPAAGVGEPGASADLEQGPDIGPELAALAKRCDAVTAQGRAIQSLKD